MTCQRPTVGFFICSLCTVFFNFLTVIPFHTIYGRLFIWYLLKQNYHHDVLCEIFLKVKSSIYQNSFLISQILKGSLSTYWQSKQLISPILFRPSKSSKKEIFLQNIGFAIERYINYNVSYNAYFAHNPSILFVDFRNEDLSPKLLEKFVVFFCYIFS